MPIKNLLDQSLIISLDSEQLLHERIQQFLHCGFKTIEIYSTEISFLQEIMQQYPQAYIGASGIIDVQQLENCYQAGIHFVSSPGFLPAIAQTANIYSMNYLPGIATLSEAMAVLNFGFNYARPFPADLSFCSQLARCIPQLNLIPTEIMWEEKEFFLNLPSVKAVSIRNPTTQLLTRASKPEVEA